LRIFSKKAIPNSHSSAFFCGFFNFSAPWEQTFGPISQSQMLLGFAAPAPKRFRRRRIHFQNADE
jgi:hypothetical protein